jgi:predicted AAA+ superfamily ATPase
MNGAMSGSLFENYVVSEIIKSYYNNAKVPYIYYYRDRDRKEIDLIIEGDGKLCPIEIKKSALPDKRMIRSFSVIEKSPLKRGTGAVICMAESIGAFDKENLIIPAWMI